MTDEIINQGIKYAGIYKAAAPGVMPKDTIKVKDEGNFSTDTPLRSSLVAVQTPQVFDAALLRHAYTQEYTFFFTDDASVVEHAGHAVSLVEGNRENIKITTPFDLAVAEAMI